MMTSSIILGRDDLIVCPACGTKHDPSNLAVWTTGWNEVQCSWCDAWFEVESVIADGFFFFDTLTSFQYENELFTQQRLKQLNERQYWYGGY